MTSIYVTQHTSLKKIGPVVHDICVPKNCPISFTFFFFFAPFYKSNFEPTKDMWINVFQIWHSYTALRDLFTLKFGDVSAESKRIMDDNIAKKQAKPLVIPTG